MSAVAWAFLVALAFALGRWRSIASREQLASALSTRAEQLASLARELERALEERDVARTAAREWQERCESKEIVCEQLNRELTWRSRGGAEKC